MSLERLWAGWRREYVSRAADADEGCVLCRAIEEGGVSVWQGDHATAVLNAYPYTSGHLLVMPTRHVAGPEDVAGEEAAELWAAVSNAVRALKVAYRPDGLNMGANLGRAGGAGVPGHFHVHVLPRWDGDTNFMTAVADTRVLPEALGVSLERVRAAWPA